MWLSWKVIHWVSGLELLSDEFCFGNRGEKLNLTSLEEWMSESKAPALEHSLKLFNEIKARVLQIVLVSSRKEHLRSATIDNLVKVGYHGWTSLMLRLVYPSLPHRHFNRKKKICPILSSVFTLICGNICVFGYYSGAGDELKSVQSYKANVRNQLINSGYWIWDIVGDQYSSLEGLPAAKRTFKLPNPMYYVSWKKPICT